MYVSADCIENVAAGATGDATTVWNSLDFAGTVLVRVLVDPYDRVIKGLEDNNQADVTYDVLSRPDRRVASLTLSNPEPVVGEEVTMQLALHNAGETAVGAAHATLHAEASDGDVIGETDSGAPAQAVTDVTLPWTPTAAGPARLVIGLDEPGDVDEYNEGNNIAWHDLYVGVAGPVELDSGAVD